jgi:hypothetical protein
MPILPGKMEKWQAMMDNVKSTPEFSESREAVGVHERTFVQRTPAGDLLIITLEGDDPAASWTKIMATMPPDFSEFAADVHGMDVNAPPPPLPELIFDMPVRRMISTVPAPSAVARTMPARHASLRGVLRSVRSASSSARSAGPR